MSDNQFNDMHMKFGLLLEPALWETDFHSLTSKYPLSLPSILYQWKIFEFAQTILLLKIFT